MAAEDVTASVHIDAPPERVYEYFTRPAAMVSWMGEYALLEAEPGGRFALDIQGAPVRGQFLELDPPHRLLVSWGYAGSGRLPPGASTVEVRLTADRGGTRVELRHRGLPPGERPGHASGWTHYLGRLGIAAAGRDPGPDPGMPPARAAGDSPLRPLGIAPGQCGTAGGHRIAAGSGPALDSPPAPAAQLVEAPSLDNALRRAVTCQ